ncbi:MAG: VWA domain-containing protein [Candidatus Scalindua sp. AMX11]|nr:MAG: VWA domain-containing protein [Candidatus Scalindua sp.]NOG86027.1 VWA domain-containing protein [Planctomycetota bacterium]RZV91348.1 MAG: VWA domain-containing protein [Candidatus Scalindua sp. SCAELEC01]TDE65905.1 MAG: VWA domain-containing protein [Candidatus Scalindua sp. AMX11]GJQ60741.1 MAG: chloride channel protein [Candidatus Scalindua sp.]
MEYQFTNPEFLKLLYLLPLFWVTAILGYRRVSIVRTVFAILLRTLVFLPIVLVLAGFGWEEKSKRDMNAVFLMDMSDSISPESKEWMWEYVKDTEKHMGKKIKKSLVFFGGESRIITPQFKNDLQLEKVREKSTELPISTDRTNISSGIMATLGMMPEDSSRMVVLLSDGNENIGDALRAARLAANNDIKVFTVSAPTQKKSEIYIKTINVPKDVTEGETFDIQVVVENKNETAVKGSVTVHQEENLLKEWKREFKSGVNVFEVPYKGEKKGFAKFVANISVEDRDTDSDVRNNKKITFVNITGKARILYIRGSNRKKSFIPEALKDKTITVDIKSPSKIPRTLEAYLEYDCLIFSNVSIKSLNKKQLDLIKKYVKDFGGGFVMTSGDNVFAKNGYSDTAIEEILPVKIVGGAPPKEEKRTRLSIILIIDKSGSMLGKKMLFAKKASIELIKQLTKNDQFGIVAFDTSPYVVLPLQPIDQGKKELIRKLSKLRADGGTDIFPALDIAHKQLVQTDAKANHVILLSDGNTRSIYYQYGALISKLKQANITVSTIALGKWLVNTKLLQDIANKTKGNFYQISDIIKLPRLIIQDSEKFISQSDFHEVHFYPIMSQKSQILRGIYKDQLPPLKGYTMTEAKDNAEVPLTTDITGKLDPILANWRYGLGKTVIYSSDADARWSSKWINWSKFDKFWSQIVHWAMRDISKTDYNLEVEAENGFTSLLIESSRGLEEDAKMSVSFLTPEDDGEELNLKQIAPQSFTTALHDIVPGTYMLKIAKIRDKKVVDLKIKGFLVPETVVSKPQEYADLGNNVPVLKGIAAISGGIYNPTKEELRVEEKEITRIRDLARYLIPLAMILFIFDIAVRKYNRQLA